MQQPGPSLLVDQGGAGSQPEGAPALATPAADGTIPVIEMADLALQPDIAGVHASGSGPLVHDRRYHVFSPC